MPDTPAVAPIPFRIRVGIAVATNQAVPPGALARARSVLDTHVPHLFDSRSRRVLDAEGRRTPLAFGVVASLVHNADLVVARELLERPGTTLEAVLPLPEPELRRRLEPAGERLDALLERCRRPVAIGDEIDDEEEALQEGSRRVVDDCDVLIALTDGDESSLLASAAAVQSAGGREMELSPVLRAPGRTVTAPGTTAAREAMAHALREGRPIIAISCVLPYEITIEPGSGLSAAALAGLEMFNSFPAARGERTYLEKVHADLFETPEGRLVPEDARRFVKQRVLPYYVRASSLAKHNQRRYLRAGLLVYCASPLAVAAVAAAIILHGQATLFFLVHLLALVGILSLVWWTHRRRSRRKWIESRFLAERLRSARFLVACGAEASSLRVPRHLGGNRRDDWMMMAFNEIWQTLPLMKGCQGDECAPYIGFVRKHWLDDQIRFHQRKATRTARLNRRLEMGGMVVFGLAILAAAGHLALPRIERLAHAIWLERALTFSAIVLPGIGASVGGFRAHREYSRLARRSEQMVPALKGLSAALGRVRSPAELEAVLGQIEQLMLVETEDWLMLMRLVKLETAG